MSRKSKTQPISEESLLHKNVVAVCVPQLDGASYFHGAFCKARRQAFQTGKEVRLNTADADDGVYAHYKATLGLRSLRWEKRVDGRLVEQTYRNRGCDVVLTRNKEGKLLKRMVFRRGAWQRSDYFSVLNSVNPILMLEPDSEGSALICSRYTGKENRYVRSVLQPIAYAQGSARQSVENAAAGGEPPVLVVLDEGEYAYCTADELQRRSAVAGEDTALPQNTLWQQQTEQVPQGQSDVDFFFAHYESENGTAVPDILPGELIPLEQEQPAREPEKKPVPAPPPQPVPVKEPAASPPPMEMPPANRPEMPVYMDANASQGVTYVPSHGIMAPAAAPVPPCAQAGTAQQYGELEIPAGNGKSYTYSGGLCGGMRSARGCTRQPDGKTAYDGEYAADKRQGFGSLYYRSGALCYAGFWQQNLRQGPGISFRESDHRAYAGLWQQDELLPGGFVFENDGSIKASFTGEDGVTVRVNGQGVWVQSAAPGQQVCSVYDKQGVLCYTGGIKDGVPQGSGTAFAADGAPEFTGTWQLGIPVKGWVFAPGQPDADGEEASPEKL